MFDSHKFITETHFLSPENRLDLLNQSLKLFEELAKLTLEPQDQLKGAMHKHRATFVLLGFMELADSASHLEQACQENINVQQLFIHFKTVLQSSIDSLKRYISTL